MAETRTWLTTPVGAAPTDDAEAEERWVRGPTVPTEPSPPWRYRGAAVQLLVLLVVAGLTLLLAPTFLDVQDPTFGDAGAERLDDEDFDPTFERPTAN